MSAFKALLHKIEEPHVAPTVGHLVSLMDIETAYAVGYGLAGPRACDVTHALYTLLRDLEMHDSARWLLDAHSHRHDDEGLAPCYLSPTNLQHA